MDVEIDGYDELPKYMQCALHYADGCTLKEAADEAGYTGNPPAEALELVERIDEGDKAGVIEDMVGADIEVRADEKVLAEYRKAQKQEDKLEFQLERAKMARKVLRAKLGQRD